MTTRVRPLWRCPKCGRTFVTRNMSHSCRRMSVADHLRDKPPEILGLYQYLHDRIRQIGPVSIDPQGRAIVFQVRARSIGVTPKAKWIDLSLWLKRKASHPRIRRIDDYGVLGRILHFRITSEDDIDARLMQLLEEAYAVGAQRSPTPRRSASVRSAPAKRGSARRAR